MIKFYIVFGALGLFLGFPNPFIQLEFLVLLYPACLYLIAKSSEQVFQDALLCGLLGSSSAMYFIFNAVYIYGQFPWFLAVPCVIIMGIYLGLWGGIFAYLLKKVMVINLFLKIVFAVFSFYILEWLRSYALTGFPWLSLSSAFAPLPEYIQLASIIGAFGLSGLYAGLAVLLAEGFHYFLLKDKSNIFGQGICFISAFVIFAMINIYGRERLKESYAENGFFYGLNQDQTFIIEEQLTNMKENTVQNNDFNYFEYYSNPNLLSPARHLYLSPNFIQNGENIFFQQDLLFFSIIQGNISQAVKWNEDFQEASVLKYLRLSYENLDFLDEKLPNHQTNIEQLFLFPETALPFFWERDELLTATIIDFAKNRNLLFGAPGLKAIENSQEDENYLYYNRLYFLQDNKISFYDKRHLVPFGEYVPSIPFIPNVFENLLQGIGGFSAGSSEQILTLSNNSTEKKLSVLICYEAIFPHLAQKDVKQGAEVFINISNDAWYDKSSAALQHLHLSLMRSVEQKRFLLRAGNTGISAIVDDYGRILANTDLFVDASLSSYVALRQEKTIFYHLSNYLHYLGFFLVISIILYAKKTKITHS